MGTAQAGGRRRARRRAGRPAGRVAHAERGQGRDLGQRPRGQGPGHGDGHPGARAGRRRRGRPTPPTRSRWPICQVWRGPAQQRLQRRRARRRHRRRRCRRSGRCPRLAGGAQVIASVSGRVAAVSPDGAVVEVGGVGLSVQCTPGTIARLQVGEPARLATSLVVREDSLTLYGFADDDERQLFELLQTANGVGPRLAQAVLAIHPPREVRRAVSMGDLTALMQVPGIGRKGAERLVLELRDRIGATSRHLAGRRALPAGVGPITPVRAVARPAPAGADAASAGPPARPTRRSPRWLRVADEQLTTGGRVDVAVLLRQALQMLGRRSMSAPFDRPLLGEAATVSAASTRSSPQAGDEERVVESALRPRSLADFIGQPKVARAARPRARGRQAPRPAAGPRAAVRPARARQDQPGPDHRLPSSARRSRSPAVRRSSGPATSPRCCPTSRPATCCSSTRSTGSPGRPRSCSTSRWRTSGSTSSSARARARPRSRWRSARSRWSARPPGPGC